MEVEDVSFNLTYPSPSITDWSDYAVWINTITGNLGWTLISLFIFIFLFINLIKRSNNALSSLSYSSFISFILSVLLRSMSENIIGNYLVIVYGFILAISVLLQYFGGDKN